jgi:hypothetical protein
MSITNPGQPYDATKARTAVIQTEIYPLPALRKRWFKNVITCDEGWSLSYSGSSWRIDTYIYRESGRCLELGGEGAAGQMDVFIGPKMMWNDPSGVPLDDQTRNKVLHNITAALQWAGYKVGFFLIEQPNR